MVRLSSTGTVKRTARRNSVASRQAGRLGTVTPDHGSEGTVALDVVPGALSRLTALAVSGSGGEAELRAHG